MSVRIFKSALFVIFASVLFACSVLTPRATAPNAAQVEREEQAVYAAFFNGSNGPVLILEDTSTSMSSDDPQQTIDYVKSGLKGISNETLDNFMERNKQSSQLSPDMQLGVDYVLLSQEELHQITSQSNWGETLREKYHSGNYTMFSRVGFNNTLDQALVYVGQVGGPLMGAGYYYLMEKQSGQWAIKDQIMVWIS